MLFSLFLVLELSITCKPLQCCQSLTGSLFPSKFKPINRLLSLYLFFLTNNNPISWEATASIILPSPLNFYHSCVASAAVFVGGLAVKSRSPLFPLHLSHFSSALFLPYLNLPYLDPPLFFNLFHIFRLITYLIEW
jgi:hypothetical protein